MEFDEEGNLLFKSTADEEDLLYDDIACGLLVKKNQYEKRDLLESLEMFYKVFFLGLDRKSTRLNSSHLARSRMPSSA